MKIGIFGGSFNPIHKGHIAIARHALAILELDQLVFVPAHKSPFKKMTLAKAQDRINMIKLHLEPKMTISDFEIKRKGISYTIETIRYFRAKYPKALLYIIIGSDLLCKLNKWRAINQITQLVTIIVFRRDNKWSKINLKKYNCKLLDNKLYPYSSLAFHGGDFANLTPEVARYIGQNYLYIKDLLSHMLVPVRYKHCLATARFAARLAKLNNYDIQKAWLAGILHDVTKNWAIAEHHAFLTTYNIDFATIPNYKLHALTGSIWVNKVYGINDNDIVSAIKNHTSLAPELSILDKIVYAADKLCEGRKYDGIQTDRQLIFNNFEAGFHNIVKKTYAYLETCQSLTSEQILIYKEWSKWSE